MHLKDAGAEGQEVNPVGMLFFFGQDVERFNDRVGGAFAAQAVEFIGMLYAQVFDVTRTGFGEGDDGTNDVIGIGAQNIEKESICQSFVILLEIGNAKKKFDFNDGVGIIYALEIFEYRFEDFDDRGVFAAYVGVFSAQKGVGIGE